MISLSLPGEELHVEELVVAVECISQPIGTDYGRSYVHTRSQAVIDDLKCSK